MKRLLFVLAAVAAFGIGSIAYAQQPKEDAVVLDKDGCSIEVSWVDGTEVATKVTVSVDGIVKQTISLDDIVGDQSAVLTTYTGSEGELVRGRLYIGSEIADEAITTITKCPTATPTSTATPAATATPQPTATPVVIEVPIEVIKTVEVPVIVTREVIREVTVRPPSTGDGGLVN